jgi:class 3 adenylate cyclase
MDGSRHNPEFRTEAIATTGQPTGRSVRQRLARLRLRFSDTALEAAFREDRFHLDLWNIRLAFLIGIGLWIAWGILLRRYMLALSDQRLDAIIRFGVFIPLLVIGLALSYAPIFRRIWEWLCVAIAITTLVVWVYYSSNILTLPAEYGYVGVILITAFTYSLLRLRFFLDVLITAVGIAVYLPYAFTARYIAEVSWVLATLYLFSFGMLGGFAAYRFERFARLLFLRQRDLDRERVRSDSLLLNILPQAVVDRLKASPDERVADAFDEISVVFVDAVGSTEQAARSSPEQFAGALDALFRWLDEVADRHGLEKIKTIGDAYHAVAGAPVPMAHHAEAAVAMALEILAGSPAVRWPSGDAIRVRAGVTTGPAVAGVIGTRKFAYDVWGDTVNLASRLQEHAEPGQVLVSERTAAEVGDRYGFGPVRTIDLKGKGPTAVRALLGARSASDDLEPAAEVESS